MLIRKGKKEDILACAKLSALKELTGPSGWHPNKNYFEMVLKSDFIFLVAEEKKVVGYVVGEPLAGKGIMLWFVSVDPAQRGKGVGSLLVKEFEKAAKRNGRRWVLLYAPQFNKETVRFYEKLKYGKGSLVYEFSKDLNKK